MSSSMPSPQSVNHHLRPRKKNTLATEQIETCYNATRSQVRSPKKTFEPSHFVRIYIIPPPPPPRPLIFYGRNNSKFRIYEKKWAISVIPWSIDFIPGKMWESIYIRPIYIIEHFFLGTSLFFFHLESISFGEWNFAIFFLPLYRARNRWAARERVSERKNPKLFRTEMEITF